MAGDSFVYTDLFILDMYKAVNDVNALCFDWDTVPITWIAMQRTHGL